MADTHPLEVVCNISRPSPMVYVQHLPKRLQGFQTQGGQLGTDWLVEQVRPDLPSSDMSRPLTDRELEILRCLPTRLSTADIAALLRISPNTVKTHLKNIYHKLEARTRNDAIVKAARLGMIPSDNANLLVEVTAHPIGLPSVASTDQSVAHREEHRTADQ